MNKFITKFLSGVITMAVLASSIVALPAQAASGNVTVFFKNTLNWSQVYCYTFQGSGGTGPAYPGTAMTSVGGGWFKYTYTGSKPLNVIFDDNGKPTITQTVNNNPADLAVSASAYWFVPTGASADNAGGMGSGSPVTVYTSAQAGFPTVTAATTSATSSAAATSSKSTKSSPSTGDNNMVPAAGAAIVLAAAGIAFTISRKKVNK